MLAEVFVIVTISYKMLAKAFFTLKISYKRIGKVKFSHHMSEDFFTLMSIFITFLQESRLHSNEFNLNSALHELYT